MPVRYSDTFVEPFSSTYNIIYSNKMRLYELPHKVTESLNSDLMLDTIKFDYLIHKNKDPHGYLLKSTSDTSRMKINVNEILKQRTLQPIQVDTMNKYMSVENVTKESESIDKYSYAFNQPGYDSLYIFVNRDLNNLNYSFSKELDTRYKGKVYKISFLLSKDTTLNSTYLNQFREIKLELKNSIIPNQKEVLELLKKFE